MLTHLRLYASPWTLTQVFGLVQRKRRSCTLLSFLFGLSVVHILNFMLFCFISPLHNLIQNVKHGVWSLIYLMALASSLFLNKKKKKQGVWIIQKRQRFLTAVWFLLFSFEILDRWAKNERKKWRKHGWYRGISWWKVVREYYGMEGRSSKWFLIMF